MAETGYEAFDDDAPEREVPEETSEREASDEAPRKRKRKKEKLDKEGSKKNKKAKGVKRLLKWLVPITGGLALTVALLGSGPKQQDKAPSSPVDDYYVTVTFSDVKNKDLDELFIYSEGTVHALVYQVEGTDDVYSICDGYVIEDGAAKDDAHTLTPLEGTELFDDMLKQCAVTSNNKVDVLEYAGTRYYMTFDRLNIMSNLSNSNCDATVSSYTDENGVVYDGLSDYLDGKVNGNNLGRSK